VVDVENAGVWAGEVGFDRRIWSSDNLLKNANDSQNPSKSPLLALLLPLFCKTNKYFTCRS